MRRETARQFRSEDPRQIVLISANSFWNIMNFRTGLIEGLAAKEFRIIVAAPDIDRKWADERAIETTEIQIDRSGLNPLRDAKTIADYFRLFIKFRPHFYLGFTPKPNIYGSIAARLIGVASIPNVSGLGTAFIKGGTLGAFLSALYRVAFRKCPVVMFQNPDDRELFICRRIVRADQARLLPGSGIDLGHFRPARVTAGPPVFLFIGRLVGDKGVREFAAAAASLKRRHPDWRFRLLGSIDEGNRTGIPEPELQSWVENGHIEHLGHASDVRPHIEAATAVVLPSYREGLPRCLLEAAAMARPMIATAVPGNRQLVRDGVNGRMCPARDSAALAEAMEAVGLMDPEQIEAMGQSARALVEEEYGQEKIVESYVDVMTSRPAKQGS